MNQPFQWAYIGCGGICRSTAAAVLPGGRHRIARTYAREFGHAAEFSETWGGAPCHTLEEAVCAPEVEGVYIGTPHNSHFSIAQAVLRMGKPVLVEKPGTVNAAQWEALCLEAKQAGLYLCEAMWTRFFPVTKQVKAWVAEGRIGDVTGVSASFATWPRGRPLPRRIREPGLAGGVLLDMGIYPLAYAHMLLGMPDTLTCETVKLDTGVDARDTVTFTYHNGAVCRLYASVLDMRPPVAKISGTRGSVWVPGYWFGKAALLREGRRWRLVRPGGGYSFQFDTVAQDIRAGRLESREVPHQATKEVLELMDRCRAQAGIRYPFE